MGKTGLELKASMAGEAVALVDATVYTPTALKIRVTLEYPYTVPPVGEDTGERKLTKVVNLTAVDFSTLTAAQRTALLNLVESKI
jgi:hypothetical protein